MNRRLSITAALFLTTVAGFIITTYGVNNGLFGGGSADTTAPQVEATGTAPPVPTAPPPQIVEQVVYRDEYVQAAAPPGGDDLSSAPAPPSAPPSVDGDGEEPESAAPPPAQPTNPVSLAGNVEAIDLNGRVVSSSNGTFVLEGTRLGSVTLTTSSSTEYEGGQFGDLTAGTRVEVKVLAAGGSQPTGPGGSWAAVKVHIEDDD